MPRTFLPCVLITALLALALACGSPAVHAAAFGFDGSVRYETFGYPDPETRGDRWENFFQVNARRTGRLAPALAYEFEGQAVADDAGFTAGAYSLRHATRRRPYFSVITAAVHYRPVDGLRVSAGKQIINWSNFDVLQPANLMTAWDESDAFRRVRHGVPAVSARFERGKVGAELAVVPLAFTPARLPQGRWQIIPTAAAQLQELPPVQLDETQAGVRLGAHLGPLDAALVGYVGRDGFAIFVPKLIFVGPPDYFALQIINRYPRLRAGGVTATYPVGGRALLRAEAVHFNSPDRDRDDFLHTAVGVEYAFDRWRLTLNYLRDDLTVRAPEEVTSTGERRFFHSFIFGELRYDAGGRLRAQLRGGYDATERFLLLQPEVSYRLWPQLRVALVGDVIDAGRFSYFDRIRHEDRLGTRVEYFL